MIRLHLVVEGQTEQAFVRDVLAPHLAQFHVFADARCVETARKRDRILRGGLGGYARPKRDLLSWMRQDRHREAFFTTMFDLYALPEEFPGCAEAAAKSDPYERVAVLEDRLRRDLGHPRDQFIPYIQVHEFEALLFSAPEKFDAAFPSDKPKVDELTRTVARFESPEHIDLDTPPSRRILAVFPSYDKVQDGPILALEVGLEAIRGKCRHFGKWLRRLEQLPSQLGTS